MSITDELRKWARNRAFVLSDPLFADRVDTYADNIDTAHERELREQYTKGHDDGFDEGFASADDWYVDHADELGEHGWVRLPVDADGKAIRIGDVLDSSMTLITASRMVVDENGRWLLQDTNGTFWYDPANLHHVKSTVEDVLREFTRDWCNSSCTGDMTNAERDAARANVIAEYAERIREAVEHE